MFGGVGSTGPDFVLDFTAAAYVETFTIAGVVSPLGTAGGVTLTLSGAGTGRSIPDLPPAIMPSPG